MKEIREMCVVRRSWADARIICNTQLLGDTPLATYMAK